MAVVAIARGTLFWSILITGDAIGEVSPLELASVVSDDYACLSHAVTEELIETAKRRLRFTPSDFRLHSAVDLFALQMTFAVSKKSQKVVRDVIGDHIVTLNGFIEDGEARALHRSMARTLKQEAQLFLKQDSTRFSSLRSSLYETEASLFQCLRTGSASIGDVLFVMPRLAVSDEVCAIATKRHGDFNGLEHASRIMMWAHCNFTARQDDMHIPDTSIEHLQLKRDIIDCRLWEDDSYRISAWNTAKGLAATIQNIDELSDAHAQLTYDVTSDFLKQGLQLCASDETFMPEVEVELDKMREWSKRVRVSRDGGVASEYSQLTLEIIRRFCDSALKNKS